MPGIEVVARVIDQRKIILKLTSNHNIRCSNFLMHNDIHVGNLTSSTPPHKTYARLGSLCHPYKNRYGC